MRSHSSVDQALALIGDVTPPAGRPLLVAIDGGGGAGKSTFARELAAALHQATVVEGDDFYRVIDEAERRELSADAGYRRYFDWERLRDEVLVPLRNGKTARYRRFDWEAAEPRGLTTEVLEVKPRGVVIIEGVYCNRRELAELYDVSVFVDTPETTRYRRLVARGENDVGWIDRWMAADRSYYDHHPTGHVNLVVSGGANIAWE